MGIMRARKAPFVAIALIFLTLPALFVASPARAADTRSGDYVTIATNETVDDNLYAVANTVSVNGTVKGDVIAVGKQITIDGTVEGSVFAVAQTVIINGIVGGSVRISGQVLSLGSKARIAHDVGAVGYSLEQQDGSSISRDVLFFGYQALVGGSVGRDVRGSMAGLEMRGRVVRDVDVRVGDTGNVDAWAWVAGPISSVPNVRPGITLAEGARLAGKLTYESGTQGRINSAQVAEEIRWKESTNEVGLGSRSPGATLMGQVQRFAMLLLVGFLLLRFAPSWTHRLASHIEARPVASVGWGVLTVLAFGLLLIIVAVAVIIVAILLNILTLRLLLGFTVGLGLVSEVVLVTAFLFFISFVVQALLSFVVGTWLLHRTRPALASRHILALVVGLVVFVIVTSIPVVGGLINLAALLSGLGAFWVWLLSVRHHYGITIPARAPSPA